MSQFAQSKTMTETAATFNCDCVGRHSVADWTPFQPQLILGLSSLGRAASSWWLMQTDCPPAPVDCGTSFWLAVDCAIGVMLALDGAGTVA